MRNTIKLRIRKKQPMSQSGLQNWEKKKRSGVNPEVYIDMKKDGSISIPVDVEDIDTESYLAKWLYLNFGRGTYIIHSWSKSRKDKRPHLTKELARVRIFENGQFEFEHIRGISRYRWWFSEF